MKEKIGVLSDGHRRFADEFLVDFNATAAYIRAGYKARGDSASSCATKLLARPEVAAYLGQRRQSLTEGADLSLSRLTQELKAIALFDPRKLYDESGVMLPSSAWPDEVAAAVAGIDVAEFSESRDGKKVRIGQTKKLSLWNKLDAIEKALKLLNAYPERKQEGPRETIVGVVVLPAKQPYQGRLQGPIEGESKRIERSEPLPPPKTKFVVPRVDQD